MSALRLVSRTKLYWGLVLIFLIGVIFSPVSSKGHNIFLSYGNLLDVLRQVSITGLVATGMTAVILIGGIDLSVGSVMAICSVVCAMLLTVPGLTPSAAIGVPAFAIAAFVVAVALTRFLFRNLARTRHSAAGERAKLVLDRTRGVVLPVLAGAVAVALALLFALPQVETKFGVIGVLLVAPCVGLMIGAINGLIIVGGRLQPFIVTLAMMVTALGLARLTAGQNNAVLPVYTGSNAVAEFDTLRSLVFGVIPMPGLFFLAAVIVYGAVLRFTAFGRYVYAIGGNEEAARLSGIDVARVKIATYAISGMLATRASYIRKFSPELPYAGHIVYRNQSAIMQEWLRMQAAGEVTGPAALWMRNSRPAEELYDVRRDPFQIENIAGEPAQRATLEKMRAAVADWMTRVGDQGLINEPEMIQRMWPGGVQPATAQPYIVPRQTTESPSRKDTIAVAGPMEIDIYVPTQGASIGYTTEDGANAKWRLYTGPIRVTAGTTLRAKAIRYGYKESEETKVVFTR